MELNGLEPYPILLSIPIVARYGHRFGDLEAGLWETFKAHLALGFRFNWYRQRAIFRRCRCLERQRIRFRHTLDFEVLSRGSCASMRSDHPLLSEC